MSKDAWQIWQIFTTGCFWPDINPLIISTNFLTKETMAKRCQIKPEVKHMLDKSICRTNIIALKLLEETCVHLHAGMYILIEVWAYRTYTYVKQTLPKLTDLTPSLVTQKINVT